LGGALLGAELSGAPYLMGAALSVAAAAVAVSAARRRRSHDANPQPS
jgi:hypothetical protein